MFSFVNGYNATNSSIQVRDIKILNAHEQASVALSSAAPVWNQGSVAGALELNFGDATDNEATVDVEGTTVDFECDDTYESYNELLLIPGAAKKLADEDLPGYKVTFIVDVLMNDVVIATYNHTAYADFVPVAGSRYDIKTTITAENIDPENEQTPIEFTVTAVNDWTNGGEKKAEIVTE